MEFSDNDIISVATSPEPGISASHLRSEAYSETVPPRANNDTVIRQSDTSPELTCLTCCCMYGRDETFSSPTTTTHKEQYCRAATKTMRKFLSSIGVYCYVLILTFFMVISLLGELLISLEIIVVPNDQVPAVNNSLLDLRDLQSRQAEVLYTLHWVNFSFLAFSFFEVLLRVFAWRLDLVRSLSSVCDCAAVTVSFVVNVVTTLAAGYQSPLNAISLIIVLRFVRVVSLVEAFGRRVKMKYQEKLDKAHSNVAEMRLANQKLHRQISEKDFEIRQLHAHLGNLDEETRKNLMEDLNKRKKISQYDSDLEEALALSKKEYEKANGGGGFDNPGYSNRSPAEGHFVPDVTIHHRENSMRRDYSLPSTSRMQPTSSGDTGVKMKLVKASPNISHGELHSGADIDHPPAPPDTALLLEGGRSQHDHWTVGYCIVQTPHSVLQCSSSYPLEDKKKREDEHVDEGIGEEAPSPVKTNHKHQRSFSAVPTSAFDDTLSDQGCVSATSLNSESGYLSDDRCHTATSKSNALSDEGKGSIQTVIHHPRTFRKASRSTDDVTMIDLTTNEAEKEESKKDENAL